jgi:hypothetical protein
VTGVVVGEASLRIAAAPYPPRSNCYFDDAAYSVLYAVAAAVLPKYENQSSIVNTE